jgi:hypothetical protein
VYLCTLVLSCMSMRTSVSRSSSLGSFRSM